MTPRLPSSARKLGLQERMRVLAWVGVAALACAGWAQEQEPAPAEAPPAPTGEGRPEEDGAAGVDSGAGAASEGVKPEATAEERRGASRLITGSAPPPEFRGPDVTLIAGEERTVYEYRQNGQLRFIKVVPKFGRPYYLAPRDPTRGWGDLEQSEGLLPEWVLIEF